MNVNHLELNFGVASVAPECDKNNNRNTKKKKILTTKYVKKNYSILCCIKTIIISCKFYILLGLTVLTFGFATVLPIIL